MPFTPPVVWVAAVPTDGEAMWTFPRGGPGDLMRSGPLMSFLHVFSGSWAETQVSREEAP